MSETKHNFISGDAMYCAYGKEGVSVETHIDALETGLDNRQAVIERCFETIKQTIQQRDDLAAALREIARCSSHLKTILVAEEALAKLDADTSVKGASDE